MKSTNYILASAALMLSLVSCSDNEEIYIDPVAATVTGNIATELTRASGATWQSGDAIGISTATTDTKTQYSNMKYVISDNVDTFTHDSGMESGIFFKDAKKVKFSAYYPFSGTEGTDRGIITIDTRNQPNQTAYDFLYAESGEADHDNPNIGFTFAHVMTKLTLQVAIDKTSGFTQTALQQVSFTLDGLKHDGQFNTASGEVATISDATAVSAWTLANGSTSSDGGADIYDMILCPQTVAGGLTFTATIGGENFYCTLSPALAAGTSYTYKITVKKTGLAVSECTITDWNPDSQTPGSATAEMQ